VRSKYWVEGGFQGKVGEQVASITNVGEHVSTTMHTCVVRGSRSVTAGKADKGSCNVYGVATKSPAKEIPFWKLLTLEQVL
jgi:hypothetical protein